MLALLLLLRVIAKGAALVGVQAQQQGVVGGLDVLGPGVTRYLKHVVPRNHRCHCRTAFDAQGLASRIGVAPQKCCPPHFSFMLCTHAQTAEALGDPTTTANSLVRTLILQRNHAQHGRDCACDVLELGVARTLLGPCRDPGSSCMGRMGHLCDPRHSVQRCKAAGSSGWRECQL